MSVKRVFVGRKNYLEDFDEFINTSSSSLDGQVLLVVGEQGMGKTALLQAMAKRVADQDHVVALGEIDRRQSDFSAQIYPIIAQIKTKQKLKLGEGSDWLKTGLTGFAIAAGVVFGGAPAALAGGAAGLGSLLVDIRNRHIATGSSPITLVELLHDELAKLDRTMGGAMRIALFMDPEKESPPDIIPLLRQIAAKGIPPRVRLIIAQRGEDAVIQAHEKGDLKGICCEPMRLVRLPDDEEISFIKVYDISQRLSNDVSAGLVSKFKGWPLLLGLAITQLLKREGDITIDDVKSLPSDIDGFWKRRYVNIKNENSLKLVQTACLLPHPYPVDRLGRFSGLQPSSMVAAMNDSSVWELFEKVSYEDTLSYRLWHGCPWPKHTTARDFVNGEVEKFEELKNELLGRIVSHYKNTLSEDMGGGGVDRDALVFFPTYLIKKDEISDFLNELYRLGPIKFRYGLLDSYISDHLAALSIYKELGRKEGMADAYGNMGNVYEIRGDLDKALEMHGKSLAINEELGRKEGMASDYGNMGNVYEIRGDLDKALEMHGKALAINEELGHKEGMASDYGNMGIVYQSRGDLDKALEMYGKALAINEKLGRKEGMANDYGNMGIVYQSREDLDKALEMYGKALAIDEELGRKEGMANDYGNMGTVYQIRGDLDKALEMYGKALAINEELGRKEGMANDYGNMGIVYQSREDLDKALEMYGKALAINEELGRKEGMADDYGNMGTVYQIRGDLDKALEMYGKALAIDEELGRKEGMANDYHNMGTVYQIRGDLDKALEMYGKSLAIEEELGRREGMANDYHNMGTVYQIRGDLDKALEMYGKALAIDEELGRKEGMANDYHNMGTVYQIRGDLDKALEMHGKSLAIEEELGRKEGMAKDYHNMGIVFRIRGDLDKALEMHGKSLAINEELGRKEGMAKDYGNMGIVYQTSGDLAKAEEVWTMSLQLFDAIGANDTIELIQSLLAGLRKQ